MSAGVFDLTLFTSKAEVGCHRTKAATQRGLKRNPTSPLTAVFGPRRQAASHTMPINCMQAIDGRRAAVGEPVMPYRLCRLYNVHAATKVSRPRSHLSGANVPIAIVSDDRCRIPRRATAIAMYRILAVTQKTDVNKIGGDQESAMLPWARCRTAYLYQRRHWGGLRANSGNR